MAAYAKAVIYLGLFSAAGYVLMKVTEPSQEKIKKLQKIEGYGSESQKKKAQFLERIKEATHETPIYMRRPDQKPESKNFTKTDWT